MLVAYDISEHNRPATCIYRYVRAYKILCKMSTIKYENKNA